jgi:gliding motility-associated-like protein
VFHPGGLAVGNYLVRYLQGGVCGTVDTFVLHLLPAVVVDISAKDTVDFGELVPLSATGADAYVWTPTGSLSCSSCNKSNFTADTTTLFFATGTSGACTGIDSILIFVRPEPTFHIPNAFTPNGDQSNDLFRPTLKAQQYKLYHLKVYSRWGERVFETYTPAEGWDGKIGEQPLESDVYLYVFEYELVTGEKDVAKGDVTLLR